MKDHNNFYIFDGAMGTYYKEVTDKDIPCELANIKDPKTILDIHKEYIKAGACGIKTNTFGANSGTFSKITRDKIIKGGIDIARDATVDTDVDVFASIGPVPKDILEPETEYREIVDIFLKKGVDKFLFETLDSYIDLLPVIKYIKEKNPRSYVLVSFAINSQGETVSGFLGQYLIDQLSREESIDGIGFNCILSPYHMRKYIESINLPEDKDISIMPNAGYPEIIGRKAVYKKDPDYFLEEMTQIGELGIGILGGCCGADPTDIKALSDGLKEKLVPKIKPKPQKHSLEKEPSANRFYDKLRSGEKVIAVEFDPPENLDMAKYIKRAKGLKDIGTDVITIADCPTGFPRITPVMAALKLKYELDMESVVHMTCRDRNLNATKAILLGMVSEDILNALVITGDPIPTAQKDEVKRVFNFNSSNLIGYIERLNRDSLPKRIEIGAGLNVNAYNFDLELNRAKKKIQNGATVFYTQPVISKKAITNIKKAKAELDAYILGGIMPLVSYRNAIFVHNEINGIQVEQDIIDNFKDLEKEEAQKLGIGISLEIMKEIEDYTDGFYLITPFQRTDIIVQILEIYNK